MYRFEQLLNLAELAHCIHHYELLVDTAGTLDALPDWHELVVWGLD